MSRLYVSKLDKDMRERIETARYTEMELEGIRGILQRTIDARMKAARGVIILFVVMDAFAAWAEVFANPNPSAEAFAVSMGADCHRGAYVVVRVEPADRHSQAQFQPRGRARVSSAAALPFAMRARPRTSRPRNGRWRKCTGLFPKMPLVDDGMQRRLRA